MNREQIDAGFDQARSERLLRANWINANDPGFWRALTPHLTISKGPWIWSSLGIADREERGGDE